MGLALYQELISNGMHIIDHYPAKFGAYIKNCTIHELCRQTMEPLQVRTGVIFKHVFVVSTGDVAFVLMIAGCPQGEKGKTTRKTHTNAIELLLLKKYWLFCTLQAMVTFSVLK